MKITNKLGLPEPFVQMVASDYTADENTYRVTSLLKGARETILEKRHSDEIEQDVADMIWLIFGTATHNILEQSQESSSQIKECRLTEEINGRKISGKFDLYDEKTKMVIDYKTCSVWKVIFGDFSDWERQLSIYAYLLSKAGFECRQGEIVAMMKDHSKAKAKYDAEYPNYPVRRIKFNFSKEKIRETERWLISKVEQLKRCEEFSDEDLPLCTEEERYNSGTKYAVMKKGKKRAMRVLDDKGEALTWMYENGGDSVEVRKGEDKKCVDYCSVCKFCSYWQENYGGEK